MYKCCLYHCDGAWGTSVDFFKNHICSAKHLVSWYRDGKGDEETVMSGEEAVAKAKAEPEPEVGTPEVVIDEERYLIQANRLPWFKRREENIKTKVGKGNACILCTHTLRESPLFSSRPAEEEEEETHCHRVTLGMLPHSEKLGARTHTPSLSVQCTKRPAGGASPRVNFGCGTLRTYSTHTRALREFVFPQGAACVCVRVV